MPAVFLYIIMWVDASLSEHSKLVHSQFSPGWVFSGFLKRPVMCFAEYKCFAVPHSPLPYVSVSPQGLFGLYLLSKFTVSHFCFYSPACSLSLLQYKGFLFWLILPASNYRLHGRTGNAHRVEGQCHTCRSEVDRPRFKSSLTDLRYVIMAHYLTLRTLWMLLC